MNLHSLKVLALLNIKYLISVCLIFLHTHTKLTLMMKQQNKLMSCPSTALGLFNGLILYDHRRAIACSKLISSKRQWVKGEKKKKKSPFRWLLVARDGDQQMMSIRSKHLSDSNSFCPLVFNMWG